MSTSYYATFYRKPTNPCHMAYVEAVNALAKAGVEKLPSELASYFKTERVAALDTNEHLEVGYHTIGELSSKTITGITLGDNPYHVVIDLDELPKDIRIIELKVS